jgi:hypothetical protein
VERPNLAVDRPSTVVEKDAFDAWVGRERAWREEVAKALMIDDQLVLRVERLRDSVEAFRDDLRTRYKTPQRPVVSQDVRENAARLGERWLVEIGGRDDVRVAVGDDQIADLSVEFQRLITYSEASTIRRRYDVSLKAILHDFRTRVVIPLKQSRGAVAKPRGRVVPPVIAKLSEAGKAFIGQSFSPKDERVNRTVQRFLEAIGVEVTTEEQPVAGSVSAKVRTRIESAEIFVGVFTRRERISGRKEWSTSAWVVDEKAYALAKDKKLVLIKEQGVQSIGGLQGDYEYLEFERSELQDLVLALLQTFRES